MMEEQGSSGQAKRKKLTGFANWPIWSMITKSMLIKNDVWDLIETRPQLVRDNLTLWGKEIKKD